MVRRNSSSSGSSYDDEWIKTKFATVDEAIKKAKSFDNFLYKQDDPDYSFDPEIPFEIQFEMHPGILFELSLEIHVGIPFEIAPHSKTHPQPPYQASAWSYR